MKILCIGDVYGAVGRSVLEEHLRELIDEHSADFTVINGENLAHGRGISRKTYDEVMSYGVDAFTLGNHTWDCKDAEALLTYKKNIVRPANFSRSCPGRGSCVLTSKTGEKLGILNLEGRVYMDPCNSPFEAASREIEHLKKETNTIIVDFHAEATSEKEAMGWFLDGRVSAVYGTHTHIQTADDSILPGGTAYITDIGMTGAVYSILGAERQPAIQKFLTGMPKRLVPADGRGRLCGCVFDIDNSGAAVGIERINIVY